MALIKCPECEKEISDRAKNCIHCGFPLSEEINQKPMTKNNMCIINGFSYDLSDLREYVLSEQRKKEVPLYDKAWELAKTIHGLTGKAAIHLMAEIQETGEIPRQFNAMQYVHHEETRDDVVRCPRCNSTAVVTGQRGYSMMWGFMGSNRTMNRCAKCGHKWEPKG